MTYFITNSGKEINFAAFNESMIEVEDIAHHLTKVNRFGGLLNLNVSYTVAQHSIAMCQYALDNNLGVEVAALCLMHDASEYVLGDVVSGLKQVLPDYRELELDVLMIILNKYGVYQTPHLWKVVDKIDKAMMVTECNYLWVPRALKNRLQDIKPLDFSIRRLYWMRKSKVKKLFLKYFENLIGY